MRYLLSVVKERVSDRNYYYVYIMLLPGADLNYRNLLGVNRNEIKQLQIGVGIFFYYIIIEFA